MRKHGVDVILLAARTEWASLAHRDERVTGDRRLRFGGQASRNPSLRRSMRIGIVAVVCVTSLALASTACRGTPLGPEESLTLTTAPDISATVAKAEYEGGISPGGLYAQYDVWLIVPPATAPNAGVVLPTRAPVFVRWNGRTYAASASDIKAGDRVEVWTEGHFAAYGAVQGPPGAPTYTGTQVVIDR
jgi:hypothetical protein